MPPRLPSPGPAPGPPAGHQIGTPPRPKMHQCQPSPPHLSAHRPGHLARPSADLRTRPQLPPSVTETSCNLLDAATTANKRVASGTPTYACVMFRTVSVISSIDNAPATRALNTRQRPSLEAVARSAPPGCHATAIMLLLWQRLISFATHQPLSPSRYATHTVFAAPIANLQPHGLHRTHSAASSSLVATCPATDGADVAIHKEHNTMRALLTHCPRKPGPAGSTDHLWPPVSVGAGPDVCVPVMAAADELVAARPVQAGHKLIVL